MESSSNSVDAVAQRAVPWRLWEEDMAAKRGSEGGGLHQLGWPITTSSPVAGGGIPALLRVVTGDALGEGLDHGLAMLRLDGAAPTFEQWLAPLAQRGNSTSFVVGEGVGDDNTDLQGDGATGSGTAMGLGMIALTFEVTVRRG
jgi:hypothetical protein